MGVRGIFVVRFRSKEGKQKAMDVGPLMFDRKLVIMKSWVADIDLHVEEVKIVPTWVKLPCLPLKYWGKGTLNKIVSLIGKPIRTERETAQKDIIEYARVLVEVSIEKKFPREISFMNENGVLIKQQVIFECKPIICGDCGGIGHTQEECRRNKYEVAIRKIKPKQVWVAKEVAKHVASVQIPAVIEGNMTD